MKSTLVWNKLLIENEPVVTSGHIRDLAIKLHKNPERTLRYLQERRYIDRIFKGIYYVKNPNERERRFYETSTYRMVAMALRLKGVKKWYFGLETALKLNGMTHEYFRVNYVITNSFRTTKVIKIIDADFQFLKWSGNHFKFGLTKRNSIFFSDAEKTVLDMTYRRYRKYGLNNYSTIPLHEFIDRLDLNKFREYVNYYPELYQKKLWSYINDDGLL